MPEISEIYLAALHLVAHDAAALAASVQRDDTGDLIGQQFTGNGNGGNLSQASLLAKTISSAPSTTSIRCRPTARKADHDT